MTYGRIILFYKLLLQSVTLCLGLGLKAKIFGPGLDLVFEAQGLGLGLVPRDLVDITDSHTAHQ